MNATTNTRPYQVGDRVRITDHNRHSLHPDAQYVFEGVVTKIDPPADPDGEYTYGPYLWADTEPYTNPSGEVFDLVFCPLSDDMTAEEENPSRTIELLAPATSNGEDVPALVQLDLCEAALERLAEKAIAWADTDPDHDEDQDTERDLLTAIAAYRAVAR